MKSDHLTNTVKNIAISVVVGFSLSLAIPQVELGRVVALLIGIIWFVYLDLRGRMNQLYDKPICLGRPTCATEHFDERPPRIEPDTP
jgi:hypothetical protein